MIPFTCILKPFFSDPFKMTLFGDNLVNRSSHFQRVFHKKEIDKSSGRLSEVHFFSDNDFI